MATDKGGRMKLSKREQGGNERSESVGVCSCGGRTGACMLVCSVGAGDGALLFVVGGGSGGGRSGACMLMKRTVGGPGVWT